MQLDTLWNGGAVSTAGNVVFQGAADGWFSAYDARSGGCPDQRKGQCEGEAENNRSECVVLAARLHLGRAGNALFHHHDKIRLGTVSGR